jgi:hypothetical protein
MKKQLLIASPYNRYIHVTPELWLQLQECDVYSKEGSWSEPEYILTTDSDIETVVLATQQLVVRSQEVVEMTDVLAENNRLTRLVGALQSKVDDLTNAGSKSSEVVQI